MDTSAGPSVTEDRLGSFRFDPTSQTPLADLTQAVPWRADRWLTAIERARRFARSRSPVLIHGESGTGKTAFAEILHKGGAFPDRSFARINCAALSPSLLASELFGHVRGAFTGAESDRPGLLRSAGHGTVFLDEVDKAPPMLQGTLLQVLDSGEARAVGSHEVFRIQARLVFATNRSPNALANGDFLPDLLYRISSLSVQVPPVRSRREDFDLLVAVALRALRREGFPSLAVAPDAFRALSAHSWPGNVRELVGTLRAAALLRRHDTTIDLVALADAASDSPLGRHLARTRTTVHLSQKVHALEREEILLALRIEAGDQAQAARRLGISRRGLNKKIHRHALVEELEREGLVGPRARRPGTRSTAPGGPRGPESASSGP